MIRNIITSMFAAVAVSWFALTACTDVNDGSYENRPVEGNTIHFSALLTAKAPVTRALDDSKEATEGKMMFHWEEGEEVALVYQVESKWVNATGKVIEVMDDGMARVDADLPHRPESGIPLKIVYPASASTTQGEVKPTILQELYDSLAYISREIDVATTETTLRVTKNGFATLDEPATLEHCFALVKFTLEDDVTGDAIKTYDLYVSDEHDNHITLSRVFNWEKSKVSNVFYVPFRPMTNTKIHFTATDADLNTYTAMQYGTLKVGCYYQKTLKMHKRVPVTELRKQSDIGSLYYSDGTWGDQAHAATAVPIGVVAYYNPDEPVIYDENVEHRYHGIVISLKDAEHEPTAEMLNNANLVANGNTYDDRYDFMWGPTGISGLMDCIAILEQARLSLVAYNMAGMYATKIMEGYYQRGQDYQAAHAAATYEPENLPADAVAGKKGSWYMGTAGEWMLVLNALGDSTLYSSPISVDSQSSNPKYAGNMSGHDYVNKVNKVLTDVGAVELLAPPPLIPAKYPPGYYGYLTSSVFRDSTGELVVLTRYNHEPQSGLIYGFFFRTLVYFKTNYPKVTSPNTASAYVSFPSSTTLRVRPFLPIP